MKVPQKLLFCQDYKVKVKTTSYKLTTSMKVSNKCSQIGPTDYFADARCICGLKKSFFRKKGTRCYERYKPNRTKPKIQCEVQLNVHGVLINLD